MTKRILIVDDEADFAELLHFRLQDGRYQFEFAFGGTDALNKARATAPDLILLDIMLPDLDGLTLCEILQRLPSTRATPIVILSAAGSELTGYTARAAGARLFYRKPVDFAQLKLGIDSLLAKVAPVVADKSNTQAG